MRLTEWILIGLITGGLGLTLMASRMGVGADSVSEKSTRQGSSKSATGGGRYYRGGKR
ncbi:hypothetical protein KKF34_01555 [Myxococcota bacterium]|nr:hypothetical protein [Myxococcota bacterium]MBU1380086.1 hypothetical protein [Myxococcota bacterium]MBU1495544.1 hypothetical protein [Myxococcota bacterium]